MNLLQTEEVLRVTVEKAISICGADIMHGADLWKRLIDIQIETLDDLIDTGSSSDVIKGAKEAIVSTYRRQFALPLLGNQRSLSSFETLLSDICIESDAQWIRPEILLEKFQRSEEQLAARIIYEQNVLSEEFLLSPITDQVSAWRAYINFEIAEKELQRAHRLYERSLLTCHQSLDLWTEYADFAATTFKQWSLVESVSGRAIKVHRSSINLWLQNLVAIESIGCMSLPSFPSVKEKDFDFSCLIPKLDQFASMKEIPVSETAEKMVKAVQTALTCSFYSAEDYLSILLYFCDFRRRELRSHLSAATHILEETGTLGCETAQKIRETIIFGIKLLRKSFSDAEGFLEMCYPEWGSGWLSLYKYQVSVEDEIISDALELLENNELFRFDGEGKEMNIRSQDDDENHDISSKASEVWERAILRFNKYYFAWGEYIQWGRSAGDFHLCRCLYGRALKSVKDFPEELCKAFLSFEQQVGTLQDYCTAKSRTKTIMKNAAAKANKATLLAKETAKIKNQKKAQKEAEVAGNYSAPKSAGIIPLVSVSSSQSVKKNSIQDQDLPNHNSSTIQNDSISIGHERQKRTLDEDISGINTSENDHNILESSKKKPKMEDSSKLLTMTVPIKNGDIETTKISVKNLSFKSSIEEILEHFKFCGEILGSELLLSKAGKSRGQAIIEFSHHSSIIEAMKLNGSLLSERSIEIELIPFLYSDSSTANASSSSSKAPSSHHPTTVFVSKFSKDLTSDQLRELFKECGDIFEARVIVDKRTGQSKVRHCLFQNSGEFGSIMKKENKNCRQTLILSIGRIFS